jgi:hypothetical protein
MYVLTRSSSWQCHTLTVPSQHNPDTTKFRILSGQGLQLQTATVTSDIFQARNTLTHRIMGPKSNGIFRFNISGMANGDRAGAALFRDNMAYIGVQKSGSGAQVIMVNNLVISGSGWPTTGHGSTAATGPTLSASQTDIWFRVSADITPAFSGTSAVRQTTFAYSLDGSTWTSLGPAFGMSNSCAFSSARSRSDDANWLTRYLLHRIPLCRIQLRHVRAWRQRDSEELHSEYAIDTQANTGDVSGMARLPRCTYAYFDKKVHIRTESR